MCHFTRPFRVGLFCGMLLFVLVACGPAVARDLATTSPLPTAGQTPPPTVVLPPTEWVPPTPTLPPVPTLVPTPVVTPIPTVTPPFISEVVGQPQRSFWIYYWQGNEVWRVDDRGQERELLLDTQQRLGQWLTAHPMAGSDCCPQSGGPRVVVSPDGGKLALVVVDKERLSYKGEPFTFSIYVFEVASRELRLVGEGVRPVWSPDGQRIAFLNGRSLWIADLVSGQIRQRVAEHNDIEMHITGFAWSPDGAQIAYTYNYGTYQRVPEIWLVQTDDETPPRQLLNQTFPIYGVQWLPDGQEIFFLSQEGGRDTSSYHSVQNLWSVSVATGDRRQLTEEMMVDNYILSPNGRWLFITGYHLYERSEENYARDLWLLSLDDRELRRITSDLGSVGAVGWSPDGTRLVIGRWDTAPLLLSLETGTIAVIDAGHGYDFALGGLK